jgi:hypothetical protein
MFHSLPLVLVDLSKQAQLVTGLSIQLAIYFPKIPLSCINLADIVQVIILGLLLKAKSREAPVNCFVFRVIKMTSCSIIIVTGIGQTCTVLYVNR